MIFINFCFVEVGGCVGYKLVAWCEDCLLVVWLLGLLLLFVFLCKRVSNFEFFVLIFLWEVVDDGGSVCDLVFLFILFDWVFYFGVVFL